MAAIAQEKDGGTTILSSSAKIFSINTPEDVKEYISTQIEPNKEDCYAHIAEDDLYQAVMTAIAEGCDNPAGMAKAALETKEIGIKRYYE